MYMENVHNLTLRSALIRYGWTPIKGDSTDAFLCYYKVKVMPTVPQGEG